MSDIGLAGWKLDKHIPVAVLVIWFFTILGGAWWMAKLDAQVQANTAWILQNSNLAGRLSAIETKLDILIVERRVQPYIPGGMERE